MRRRDAVGTEEPANCSTMRIGRRRFGIAKPTLPSVDLTIARLLEQVRGS